MNKQLSILSAAVLALSMSASAQAVISVNTSVFNYSQSFDSLATTGTANAWANDSSLPGWSLFNKTPAAIPAYAAGDGSVNTGSFYSFGTGTNTDRALGGTGSGGTYFGSPASGTVAGWIAVAFQNNTGMALDKFTLGFDGEQWRNGGNASAQTMTLEYGFGGTFAAVASWTKPAGNFDWISPVATTTAAAVNGNVAGLVASRGGDINATWTDSSTLWVRWVENNDTGNDHGLAIDNFSLSVTAVPEPETYALMLAGLGLVGFMARRRKN